MVGGQFVNGGAGTPFLPYIDTDRTDGTMKLSHDRYEVYVNGDFVGKKVLLNDSDQIDDVASFLHSRGIEGFTTQLEGDHYNIETKDADAALKIKDQLRVYLQIR